MILLLLAGRLLNCLFLLNPTSKFLPNGLWLVAPEHIVLLVPISFADFDLASQLVRATWKGNKQSIRIGLLETEQYSHLDFFSVAL